MKATTTSGGGQEADPGNNYRSFTEQALHYFTRTHEGPALAAVGGPAAWRGKALAQTSDWIHTFSTGEVQELEAAIGAARHAGPGSVANALPGLPPTDAERPHARLAPHTGRRAWVSDVAGAAGAEVGRRGRGPGFLGAGPTPGNTGRPEPPGRSAGSCRRYRRGIDEPQHPPLPYIRRHRLPLRSGRRGRVTVPAHSTQRRGLAHRQFCQRLRRTVGSTL